MKSILILFDNVITLYIWVLIINAIISWLVAFNILNTNNRFVYSVLEVSYKLTDPPLNFIRRFFIYNKANRTLIIILCNVNY